MSNIIEALILASALSIDAFVVSFAYGSNRIKIPFLQINIINILGSSVLALSLLAGIIIKGLIPAWLTIVISFTILFSLGIIKLLDSITKSVIKRNINVTKQVRFSFLNFKFIINLYANPEAADQNSDRIISPVEAIALALALSLDGLAIGFGAALGNTSILTVLIASLITDLALIILGLYLGHKLAKKTGLNLSWLSGVILIIIAFMNLVF